MNTRQWMLYNLIKQNSLLGKKTTQKEICDKIDGYEYKERKGTTDKCSAIWTDVRDINLSGEIDKVIITKKYIYWIGSEEETIEYLEGCWKTIAPALSRYWQLVKKIKNNGQYKLLSNRLKPIDEDSKARLYVESFIEEPKEKSLEEMDLEELREIYRELCDKLNYGAIRYYDKKIYINEINFMRNKLNESN